MRVRVVWLTLRYSPGCWAVVWFGIVRLLIAAEGLRSPLGNVVGTTSDIFAESGAVPSGRQISGELRTWSSWSGSDQNRGALVLGPIKHTKFSLLGMGYPQIGGNRIALENLATGATFDLQLGNFGEEWTLKTIESPREWGDAPTALRVVDDAAEWGGWVALSEPFVAPWWCQWWTPNLRRIAEFLLVGATLLAWLHVMALLLQRRGFTWASALPLFAGGLVAFVGYAIFWAYFAHSKFGGGLVWMANGIVLTLGLCAGYQRARGSPGLGTEFWSVVVLLGAIGIFYVAALHAFDVRRIMSDLAMHRFSDGLPADNIIPQSFAEFLQQGRALKPFFGDWLSSDRPPLQVGWILLLSEPARVLQQSLDTVAQCAGIWFQLLWVPAVWLWLRAAGAARWQAALVVTLVMPCGMLFLNTTFVWPKLGAGALALGAFVVCFFAPATLERRRRMFVGGGLMALAALAHAGVAFALLALVPLAIWRLRHDGVMPWMWAAVGFALLVTPWLAYQKFYDPPGNRLVKWHLAGVIPPDDRGTWETLADAYRSQPLAETWRTRVFNTRLLAHGDWADLFTFSFQHRQIRRHNESTWMFFSLGWWVLGLAVIPVAWRMPLIRRRWRRDDAHVLAVSVAWALATLVVWVALMFLPGSTSNHQGTYTVFLVLVAALAFVSVRAHWIAAVVIGLLQAVNFVAFWLDPPAVLGPVSVTAQAAGLMAVAALVMSGLVVWLGNRTGTTGSA